MSNRASTCSDSSETPENVYCILLHIVEGVGLFQRDIIGDFGRHCHKDSIVLNASLNGAKFEVEGHSTETTTIFNSNCIWECEMGDVKRMKTDNRPVKVVVFMKTGHSDNAPRKAIGTLLLPIRGAMVVNNMHNIQLRQHWHKLNALHADWRKYKPEINLLLAVVKKSLVSHFEAMLEKKKSARSDLPQICSSETSNMLQSQSNVYVQLLEQVGLIQVGNNPDIDCDIFNVSLIFKQLKNVYKLFSMEQSQHGSGGSYSCIFHYDFLGSISQLDIHLNANDCYPINEKISLSFKSSLMSLRMYFQRVFYIPITLYINGSAIASYHFNFSMHLPDNAYFNIHQLWSKTGTFFFDRYYRPMSGNDVKPSVDFLFTVQLATSNPRRMQQEQPNACLMAYRIDERAAGDVHDGVFHNWDMQQIHNHNYNNFEIYERTSIKVHSEQQAATYRSFVEDLVELKPIMLSVGVATEDGEIPKTVATTTIGTNTEPVIECPSPVLDQEELTVRIVQELEEWKKSQMEQFLVELERKESVYMSEMQEHWENQRSVLQAKLAVKIAKCEELNAKLEKAYAESVSSSLINKDIMEIVERTKQEIERSYESKFQNLDNQMQKLKLHMQQKGKVLEVENKDVKAENSQLLQEKQALHERIAALEKQLINIESNKLSAEQFKEMLQNLQIQKEQVASVEKTKNYYKGEWTKAMREVNRLKLSVLKQQEKTLYEKRVESFDICLDDILQDDPDEQDDQDEQRLNSERSELQSLSDILFPNSETSSLCDLEEQAQT